jgi:YVTN family beta-propeller protein
MPRQRPKKKSDVQGHIVIARNVAWTARPPAPPGSPQPRGDAPGVEPAPEPGRSRRRPALVAGALALGTATGLIIASTLVPDGAAGGGNEPPPAGEPAIGTIGTIGAITVGPDPGGIDFFNDRDGGRRAAVAVGVGFTLVDTGNNVVDETLDLESRGADIAVALGNSRTCVATDEGLVVLDSNPSTPQVLGVALEGEEVQSVVAAPDGDRVYATTPSGVTAVDVRTGAVTPIDDGAGRKPGLEVSPDGARIYVANADHDLVSVIDPATATSERTIATGPFTLDVALSPTSPTGYVAQASAVGVFATDGTTPAFTTIPVPGGDVVQAVAVTPDGRRVFAVTRGGGRVIEIDAGTRTVTRASDPDSAVTAADIAVTDTHAYVSDRASGRLIVLDISGG